MRNFKYILTLVLTCGCLCSAIAQTPKDEATFKQIRRSITLLPDGSMEDRVMKEIALHNHMAFNDLYGETFVIYNPDFQEVKINRIYTTQKDGSIVEMPENAYNEVLPSFAANAVAYNNLKELVITHTGLEIGATIYADYSVITKPGFYPALDKVISINEEQPITNYTLEVTVPNNKTLSSQLVNSNVKPTVEKKEEATTYTWRFRNIKPRSKQLLIPAVGGDKTCIYVSTFGDKDEAFNILRSKGTDQLNDTNIQRIKSWIPSGNYTPTEIINALNTHFDVVKIPASVIGYTVRPLDAIFQSAYYTPLEKWYLIQAVGSQLGITLTPTIAIPAFLPQEYASLEAINDYILLNNNEPLNGAAQYNNIPAIQWWNVTNGQNITPTHTEKFVITSTYNIAVAGNKANVSVNTTCNNRFKTTSNENKNQLSLQKKGTLEVLSLPIANDGIKSLHITALQSTRNVPLQLAYPLSETDSYTITWSDTQQCRTQVPNININNKVGNVRISGQKSNDKLTIIRHIEINKTMITATDYQELRSLVNAWNNVNTLQLLFQ
ncbi:MAG: DUF3857 domain-containing protein [Marinifilaceae bacterium]